MLSLIKKMKHKDIAYEIQESLKDGYSWVEVCETFANDELEKDWNELYSAMKQVLNDVDNIVKIANIEF